MKTISKERAEYKPLGSKQKHCGNCSMFDPPHSCTLVRGTIDPYAVCKHWESRDRP